MKYYLLVYHIIISIPLIIYICKEPGLNQNRQNGPVGNFIVNVLTALVWPVYPLIGLGLHLTGNLSDEDRSNIPASIYWFFRLSCIYWSTVYVYKAIT